MWPLWLSIILVELSQYMLEFYSFLWMNNSPVFFFFLSCIFFLGYIPQSRIAGSSNNFMKNSQMLSEVTARFFNCHQHFISVLISLSEKFSLLLFDFSHLLGMKCIPLYIVLFTWQSTCQYTCRSNIFAHFKIGLSSLLSCRSYLNFFFF